MKYIIRAEKWATVMLSHILLLLILVVKESHQGYHEERLINDIFTQRGYNKLARPVKNDSGRLEVKFGITLQQIIDVDEKNEMLHTNLWLNYDWLDYNLSWNKTKYGGVESIRLPSTMIWNPDILMYNSADEDIDSKYPTNIVVYANGQCSWVPLGLYISSCAINIKWFPFDDQICTMKFGSWTYDGGKINLTSRSDVIDISTYQPSGEWILVDWPAERHEVMYECCPDPYIDITFKMHIRRRTVYYGFNLIIPCALISALTLLIFLLPPEAGEKVGLGITILLSLSVFSLIVAESVPSTSLAVPLLGVYFACIMFMCTISVITTVIVLNCHHRNPDTHEMPDWIQTFVCEWLAWMLRMSRPGRDLSRKNLLRKAKMKDLESRNPPSVSLISNVKDVDNTLPLNSEYRSSEYRSEYANSNHRNNYISKSFDSDIVYSIKGELLSILNELRFMTNKVKEDDETGAITNDWVFAAMVIDRLCFWVFAVYMVVTTLAIYLTAPHIFDMSPKGANEELIP